MSIVGGRAWAALGLGAVLAVGGCPGRAWRRAPDPLPADWQRPVEHMALTVDHGGRTARAVVRVGPGEGSVSLAAGGLAVEEVRGPHGAARWAMSDGRLDIWAPSPEEAVEVEISYAFRPYADRGVLHSGATRTWPYYCGTLFPCRPDPDEPLTFELSVANLPDGEVAVFPDSVDVPGPSYMLAWAVGPYTRRELGTTWAGTQVTVWYLPGSEAAVAEGTADLVAMVGWLEQTLGEYPYGTHVGSVEVQWPEDGYGAMEHHPYWHVESEAMGRPATHAHEAAHGWFGDGIRLRCWEDLTLSEGVASYLAARAVGAVQGEAAERALWHRYQQRLDWAVAHEEQPARPEGCGEIDVLDDGLFSEVPYMKGAFFLRAVEDAIGREAMDDALAAFVAAWLGKPAGVDDLLRTIEAETGFDPGPLADRWLRQRGGVP